MCLFFRFPEKYGAELDARYDGARIDDDECDVAERVMKTVGDQVFADTAVKERCTRDAEYRGDGRNADERHAFEHAPYLVDVARFVFVDDHTRPHEKAGLEYGVVDDMVCAAPHRGGVVHVDGDHDKTELGHGVVREYQLDVALGNGQHKTGDRGNDASHHEERAGVHHGKSALAADKQVDAALDIQP